MALNELAPGQPQTADTFLIDLETEFRTTRPDVLKGDHYWTAFLEVLDTSAEKLFEDLAAQGLHPGDSIAFPNISTPEHWRATASVQSVFVIVRADLLRWLNENGRIVGVNDILIGPREPSLPLTPVLGAPTQEDAAIATDAKVVIGVIDRSVGLGHEVFCDSDGNSLIDGVVIMRRQKPSLGSTRTDEKTQREWRVFGKAKLSALLKKHTFGGQLDDNGFYEALGLASIRSTPYASLLGRSSHGSATSALAYARVPDSTEERVLLSAMPPTSTVTDYASVSTAVTVLETVDRVARVARRHRTAKGKPIATVFNLSFATLSGSHDGNSFAARTLTRIAKSKKAGDIQMVLPAGNQNLSQAHAQIPLHEGRAQSLHLEVRPDNHKATNAFFWLPPVTVRGSGTRLEKRKEAARKSIQKMAAVTLTSPLGDSLVLEPADSMHPQGVVNAAGNEIGMLSFTIKEHGDELRGYFLLSLHPTASLDADRKVALAGGGLWTFTIHPSEDADAMLAWIQNEPQEPEAGITWRPSRFVTPEGTPHPYVVFDSIGQRLTTDPIGTECLIRRDGTMNDLGTGNESVVVGGYRIADTTMAPYSAASRTTGEAPRGTRDPAEPDAALPCEISSAVRGIRTAGTQRGSYVLKNGTSMSCALATRLIANHLANGKSTEDARAWLRHQARVINESPRTPSLNTAYGLIKTTLPFNW